MTASKTNLNIQEGDPARIRGSSRASRQPRTVLFFAIFAIVSAAVCPVALQFDQSISDSLRGWKMPGDLKKMVMLSEAFAHGAGVFFILLSVFVVAISRRRTVLIALLITALSGVISNGLKATVVRVRPHAVGLQVKAETETNAESHAGDPEVATEAVNASELVVEASFWDARQRSFPSGHTATAWGLAIGLSLCFPRAWWIFTILAILATVQRLESGAHYPSDVFAGAAIAFTVAACILAIPKIRATITEDNELAAN